MLLLAYNSPTKPVQVLEPKSGYEINVIHEGRVTDIEAPEFRKDRSDQWL